MTAKSRSVRGLGAIEVLNDEIKRLELDVRDKNQKIVDLETRMELDGLERTGALAEDPINHPSHYQLEGAICQSCGGDIECIDVTEHMDFSLGNAIKYIWRAGRKDDAVRDLRKAIWYIQRKIARLEALKSKSVLTPPSSTDHEEKR